MTRAALALLALATAAHADKARDCYMATLNQPAAAPAMTSKPRELGCFRKIKITGEEHAYGFGACFVAVDGGCKGTFDIYDADISPDQAVFESVTCKDGKISFVVKQKWRTSYTDVGPFPVDISFTGKIVRGTLRGDLTEAGKTTRVLWRAASRGAVLERVRMIEAIAQCTAKP